MNMLLVHLALLFSSAASTPGTAVEQVASPSLQTPVSIIAKDVSVEKVVDLLRQQGIPISFVELEAFGGHGRNIFITADRKPLEGVLGELTTQEPGYRFAVIEHRLVLFPADGRLEREVDGVAIEGRPRIRAIWAYAELLASRFPDFATLATMALRGRPGTPLYSDAVSLRSRATVVEHLVELLGANESIVFSITRSRFDTPYLSFEQSGSGQQQP
jgi:hypothetical protein